MSCDQFLEEGLRLRKLKKNDRHLAIREGLVDFSSNDYLGFSRSYVWNHFGKLGSTGSRLLTGNSLAVEELERKLPNSIRHQQD